MYSFWSSKSSLLYRVTASFDDEPGLPTYSIHTYTLMHTNIMACTMKCGDGSPNLLENQSLGVGSN